MIQSGGDTTLKGAQVKGRGVALSAENLNIESVQDSAAYNDRRFQGSAQITVGYGFSGSAGYSQSKTNADHRSISEQSGIYAGDGGFQVNIKGHTDLKGGIITATEAAEQNGRNRFQTATLSRSDIENHSRYQGGSFGIGMSGNADGGRDGRQQDGLNKGIGFGRDGGSRNSTTRSGIGTRNITIGNDPDGTQAQAVYTDTRTETAEANTGRLNNMFDKDRVRKELDRQREVTQQFGGSVQQVRTEINRKAEGYRKLAKIAEEEAAAHLQNGDTAGWSRAVGSADENRRKAGQWQKGGAALSALASGLSAPTDSALGIVSATANPIAVYALGQEFKRAEKEGSAAHILAHGILAAATAASADGNALAAGLSAAGAEAVTPYVAEWLYGTKEVAKLTAEQKETVSAVISLGGAVSGASVGRSAADAVTGSRAAQSAVEDNAFRPRTPQLIRNDMNRAARDLHLGAIRQKIPGFNGFPTLRNRDEQGRDVITNAEVVELRAFAEFLRTQPAGRSQAEYVAGFRNSRNVSPVPNYIFNQVIPKNEVEAAFIRNANATFSQSKIWNSITRHRGELVIQRSDIPLTPQNIIRMKNGNAPYVRNQKGDWEPVTLHHVGRATGQMIEISRSQNRYDHLTGGALHIPGPGNPVRQSQYTATYWKQRYQDLINSGKIQP